jgi:predicted GNAT family N-acyltransferase
MFLFGNKDIVIKIAEGEKEREGAMDVRRHVFQKDQGIDPEADFDGKDDNADHIIAYVGGKEAGTLRIRYLPEDDKKNAEIERVAVLRKFRGQDIGKKMMEYALSYLKNKGIGRVMFKTREHTKEFYEGLGFRQEGEVFADGGIPNIMMSIYLF